MIYNGFTVSRLIKSAEAHAVADGEGVIFSEADENDTIETALKKLRSVRNGIMFVADIATFGAKKLYAVRDAALLSPYHPRVVMSFSATEFPGDDFPEVVYGLNTLFHIS